MKKALIPGFVFGLIALLSAFVAPAQTIKDVFTNSETPIFYLGVDYTYARLIDDATASGIDLRDKVFPSINDLIVNEPKRYDLAGAFHRTNIDHDLKYVAAMNAKINAEEIKSTNSGDYSRLKAEDIQKQVSKYSFGDLKGVGLLILVEGMSKGKKGASMWVTFVDTKTKKVLMTERVEGETGMGFGLRNYWSNPIRNVIEDIEKHKYKDWKAKYGG